MTYDESVLDFNRAQRLGFGEAIFCKDKSAEQIADILRRGLAEQQALLLTRLARRKAAQLPQHLSDAMDYDASSRTAFFLHQDAAEKSSKAEIAVVTAGTSDSTPAREAIRTLAFHGVSANAYFDIGVAGLWRLLDRLEDLNRHALVIVVAGMDAALPSVLGGLVGQPIIAVPSSTGYGAARKGETALAACLSSCAPGIVVCNIDNGYGAACAAMRFLNQWPSCTRSNRQAALESE
ncbi:MAG: nickel pincer cofactor biosynthesis protein LarB [Hyphomicrobiaceae bacterium]